MAISPSETLEHANRRVSEWAKGRADVEKMGVRSSDALGPGTFQIFVTISAQYKGKNFYHSRHVHPSSFFYDDETFEALMEDVVTWAYIQFHHHIYSGGFDEEIARNVQEAQGQKAKSRRNKGS